MCDQVIIEQLTESMLRYAEAISPIEDKDQLPTNIEKGWLMDLVHRIEERAT